MRLSILVTGIFLCCAVVANADYDYVIEDIMWKFLYKLASPQSFYRLTGRALPLLMVLTVMLLIVRALLNQFLV